MDLRHIARLCHNVVAGALLIWSVCAGGQTNAVKHLTDDPHLPNVLIIGDSISMGYTDPVARLLEGKANVRRVPENCQSTVYGLAHVKDWLGNQRWDIIHFNWGIWDMHHLDGDRIAVGGRIRTTPKQYDKNLRMLLGMLESTGAKLIWASTTPVRQPTDPSFGMNAVDEADVPIYNRIAARIMKAHKIQVDDLYRVVVPYLDRYRIGDNVHYTAEGSELLAQQVVKSIQLAMKSLDTKEKTSESR